MLFNSLSFGIFLPIVFFAYWAMHRSLRAQNGLILVASYVFYGWWDWRFLSLIALSTAVDYFVGHRIGRAGASDKARKAALWTSIAVNIGLLGVFKYFNFFAESFAALVGTLGLRADPVTLHVILPVGISFYTFQTLSYTIDVYRGRLEPTRDPVAFAAYVCFFPQLVAGPIERASNLLPQFQQKRRFDPIRAQDGIRQILWGLFKKVAVADSCGLAVDRIFDGYGTYSSVTLAIGAVLFAFQIYGDFSGYSDIAIGTARLFGIGLMRNFANPYFSRDIAEFWRRWHISLSTWFRDYVYFPLGGSKVSRGLVVRNVFLIFLVSGFWHGANWTFLAWGGLNALYFLPLLLRQSNRENLDTVAAGRLLPTLRESAQMASTFGITTLAWIFFRAESVTAGMSYLRHMFEPPWIYPVDYSRIGIGFAIFMLLVEWVQRGEQHGLARGSWPPLVRRSVYIVCVLAVMKQFGVQSEFIYFQF